MSLPDSAAPSFSSPGNESIYLHVFEQEVSAVEDPDLLDVALGGPDTTQRIRLMKRIERLAITGSDCASALAEDQADWLAQGFEFDPATSRLVPQAKLQVSFGAATTTANPCDPVAGRLSRSREPTHPRTNRSSRRQRSGADFVEL